MNKKKVQAAGKILRGVGQAVSGVATATGHGLVGGYCRRHGMMRQATRLGAASARAGKKTIEDGINDWKRASSS